MVLLHLDFISLSEIDTQDWPFFDKYFKQFDSRTITLKAQVQAQNIQMGTHESISIYICFLEDLVKKNGLSLTQTPEP